MPFSKDRYFIISTEGLNYPGDFLPRLTKWQKFWLKVGDYYDRLLGVKKLEKNCKTLGHLWQMSDDLGISFYYKDEGDSRTVFKKICTQCGEARFIMNIRDNK